MLKQTLVGTVVLLLLAATAALTACSKNATADPSGSWSVTTVDNIDVSAQNLETTPTLNIDLNENKAWGNLSCNSYNAPVTCAPERGELKLGTIASTRMACQNLEVEFALGAALESIDHYKVQADGTLELYAGDQLRIRLTKVQ